jgi:hypothetical protein
MPGAGVRFGSVSETRCLERDIGVSNANLHVKSTSAGLTTVVQSADHDIV